MVSRLARCSAQPRNGKLGIPLVENEASFFYSMFCRRRKISVEFLILLISELCMLLVIREIFKFDSGCRVVMANSLVRVTV